MSVEFVVGERRIFLRVKRTAGMIRDMTIFLKAEGEMSR